METIIAKDRRQMGQYVATQAARFLRSVLAEKDLATIVVATGSSQFEVLDSLVQQPDVDWSRVEGFHLDEYLGLDRSHPASFCGYLEQRFVSRVPLRSFFYLDGTRDAEELLAEANALMRNRTIDLLLCGIGENGHLAFNDPPADFEAETPYLLVTLDEACRRQQVGEGWFDSIAHVPTRAISMSIPKILSATKILCSVPDRRKAEAVKNTLEGEVTPDVPASILQRHPDTILALDESSASLLSPETLQRCRRLDVEEQP